MHVSAGIPAESAYIDQNTHIFAIISETPQVVLKRFKGRTNISLMFLFPWLDWGNDISDFEKIDFLAGQAILSVFSTLQKPFFTLGTFSQLGLESPRRKILKKFFF